MGVCEATQEDASPELTEDASKAIDAGLTYLLKTQGKDGSWSSGKFQMACTSLGLMSFMVKGEFPGYGPNADALDRAKNWLLKQAKTSADGYLGQSMYEHGLATLALSEMWGMTKGEKDDEDIQKALEAAYAREGCTVVEAVVPSQSALEQSRALTSRVERALRREAS